MNEWKQFFNEWQAEQYEDYCFTKDTLNEIAFLMEELNVPAGAAILDVGCGTGRHAIALAERGFTVTGVDLSPYMLARARNAAECTGVTLRLIECNAMDISFENEFDAAICLCEGALTLLGSDDDPFERDQQVLNNICRALKPGGKFITTVLNAYRKIRELSDEDVAAGKLDPVTLVEKMTETVETDDGPLELTVHERGYTPPEFIRMLTCAGFTVDHIYGGTAGDWGRRTVKLDEMEFMAITHT